VVMVVSQAALHFLRQVVVLRAMADEDGAHESLPPRLLARITDNAPGMRGRVPLFADRYREVALGEAAQIPA
jgi:hypothetical protein